MIEHTVGSKRLRWVVSVPSDVEGDAVVAGAGDVATLLAQAGPEVSPPPNFTEKVFSAEMVDVVNCSQLLGLLVGVRNRLLVEALFDELCDG